MTSPTKVLDLKLPPTSEEESRLMELIIQGLAHDEREMFDSLTPHEKALALQILREASGSGKSKTEQMLWEMDYRIKPPNIKQFMEDTDWFGEVGKQIWPVWRRHLEESIFNEFSPIHELALTGAIGTGKTSCALVAQCYKMACLLCLRDPQTYYGFFPGSQIVIGLFNITADLAYRVLYSDMRSYMKTSPFFMEHMILDDKVRGGSETIRFKNEYSWLTIALGSDSIHALGQNVISGVLDEMAFKSMSASATRAVDLYFGVSRRLTSRFMEGSRDGKVLIPGLLTLVSSKKFATDFIEEHIKKMEQKPGCKVISVAQWDAKPRRWSGKTFKVLVGDKFAKSRIITDETQARDYGPEVRVIDVPVEYKSEFESYLDESIRDIAGIMTYAEGVLIPRRDKIIAATTRDEDIKHPFSMDELIVDLDDPESLIQNYIIPDLLVNKLKVKRGEPDRFVPKKYPRMRRYLHIDPSVTGDSTGIAMGCRGFTMQIERFDHKTGLTTRERAPFIHIDFMLRVNPPVSGEIDLAKIRSFIIYLSMLGFELDVSYDTYQSRDSQQMLAKQGFGRPEGRGAYNQLMKPMTLSVDRDDAPYLSLRSAIMEDRIAYYNYPIFIKEAGSVLYDRQKRKVDHPPGGSKDVSDAVAAVVHRINEEAPEAAVSEGPLPSDVIFGPDERPLTPQQALIKEVQTMDWVVGDYDKDVE